MSPADTTPPSVSVTITPVAGNTVHAPGESLELTLTATDDQQLAWLGYALGPPALLRDSVPLTGTEGDITRTISIDARWDGRVSVSAFAWDAAGKYGVVSKDTVDVVDAVRRPFHELLLMSPVYDVASDAKRNQLYLSQPAAQQIAVLDLETRAFQSPIALFGSPWGLDLTLSGDSLLVALRRTHYLAFVNLSSSVVDTVRLNMPSEQWSGPANLRVMANGNALLTLTCDFCSGFRYRVWQYQISTGVAAERTDVPMVTEFVPLVRGHDRQRLLALIDNACCPVKGWVYEAENDAFTVMDNTVNRYFPSVSTDATGSQFLIGASVFDASLRLVAELQAPQYNDGATVIASDGTAAFIAVQHGYVKVRIPDGAVLERVLLPITPHRLLMIADEQTLIAMAFDAHTGQHLLWLVDLQ